MLVLLQLRKNDRHRGILSHLNTEGRDDELSIQLVHDLKRGLSVSASHQYASCTVNPPAHFRDRTGMKSPTRSCSSSCGDNADVLSVGPRS